MLYPCVADGRAQQSSRARHLSMDNMRFRGMAPTFRELRARLRRHPVFSKKRTNGRQVRHGYWVVPGALPASFRDQVV